MEIAAARGEALGDDLAVVAGTSLDKGAERQLGEMLREQKETVGLADGGDAMKARFREGTEVRPTLRDVGIDKKLQSAAALKNDSSFSKAAGKARRVL